MKTVSDAYTLGMAQPLRKRSYIQITLMSGGQTYTFDDNDLSSVQKTADIDPLSRRLPKETLTFSIFDYTGEYNPANPSGKWNALDENASISVRFGFTVNGTVEWLSPDYYLLDGKPTVSGGIATFQASSRIAHLTKTYYKGTAGSKSLYDIAVSVFTDAGLSAAEYSIDSSLGQIYTTAPMPITSHQNCLQMIAHASGCTLRTDSNNVIRIEPFSAAVSPEDFIIGLDSVAYNGDKITKIETLYKVQAYKYEYSVSGTLSVIYESTIDVDGTLDCHIEYDSSTEQTISATDGTLSNIHTYAGAADFTITGSGTFTLTVTGKKITTSSSLSKSTVSQNTSGSTDTEKNPLITDSVAQSSLIYRVANYLQYRMTHTVSYRGNPEVEAGDGVYLQTMYGSYIAVLTLAHTINYNGALSGTLILKSMSEVENADLYDCNLSLVEDVTGETVCVIGTSDYTSEFTTSQVDSFITEVID